MVEFATQVKRRRGTTAENDAFTGAEGEITVDLEKHELRLHDGQTQGGFVIGQGGGGSGSGRNIGDIFYTTRNDESLNGSVECNGGTYNTEDYTGAGSIGELLEGGLLPYVSLAQYATLLSTNGAVGVFGWDGTGTTEFRVPTLKDIFIECGQANELGDYIGAGLPNITASVHGSKEVRLSNYVGAFYSESSKSNSGQAGTTGTDYHELNFDASLSNPIYGNSDTVQPKAIKYRAMVQLFNSTTDEAVATVGTVVAQVGENTTQISDLRNMSNVTSTGKEAVVGWGMPDYSAGVSIENNYTAPKDGFIIMIGQAVAGAREGYAYINNSLVGCFIHGANNTQRYTFYIPINKSDVFTYTDNRGTPTITFYPYKGVN